MTITIVGSHEASGTSISVTAQPGDLIVLFMYRDGSTSSPTIPSGINWITNASASATWIGVASLLASTQNPVLSGFTNVTRLAAIVLRSSVGHVLVTTRSVLAFASVGGGGVVTYAALTQLSTAIDQVYVAGVTHRSNDVDTESPPAGMTNQVYSVGGTGKIAIHSTASGQTSWPSTTVTLATGTSALSRTAVIEICETGYAPTAGGNNAQLINGGLVRGLVL